MSKKSEITLAACLMAALIVACLMVAGRRAPVTTVATPLPSSMPEPPAEEELPLADMWTSNGVWYVRQFGVIHATKGPFRFDERGIFTTNR